MPVAAQKLQSDLFQKLDGNTFGEPVNVISIEDHTVEFRLYSVVAPHLVLDSSVVGGVHPTGLPVGSESDARAQLLADGNQRINETDFNNRVVGAGQSTWLFILADRADQAFEKLPQDRSVIESCVRCSGSGKMSCDPCWGTGKVTCSGCHGSGQVSSQVTVTDGKGKTIGTKTVYHPCGGCHSSGRVTCSSCGGSGQIVCGYCNGSGKQTRNFQIRIYLRSEIVADIGQGPPTYFERILLGSYNNTASRKGFEATSEELSMDGGNYVFRYRVLCEIAAGLIEVSQREYPMFAIGKPAQIELSPTILDDLHAEMSDKLAALQPDEGGELYDICTRSKVGERALEAAAAGQKEFEPGPFAPLLSDDMATRLFLCARDGYNSIGRRMRRRSWALFLMSTPVLAFWVNLSGYQSWADSVFQPEKQAFGVFGLCLILFVLLWFAFLSFTVLRQRQKTKKSLGESIQRATVLGSGPWWSLGVGTLVFGFVLVSIQSSVGETSDLNASKRWLLDFAPYIEPVMDGLTAVKEYVGAQLA